MTQHPLGLALQIIMYLSRSPSAQFLAAGSFDETVRVFNNLTWRSLGELKHPALVTSDVAVVYVEELLSENGESDIDEDGAAMERKSKPAPKFAPTSASVILAEESARPSKFIIAPVPFPVPSIRVDPESPDPTLGVGICAWSRGDEYLMTRNENMPRAVWIWDLKSLSLCSVLIHREPVRAAEWDPTATRLAICTGDQKIYMWRTDGVSIVSVPAPNFSIRSLKWREDGKALVLLDKVKFCCCYLQL
jgi:WD40 repeat protein